MVERIAKAYEHYGIDPEAYGETMAGIDLDWCPVCGVHSASSPLPRCDLEIERAFDMEREGFKAKFCPHCAQAYPALTAMGGICPACRRKDIKKQEELSKQRESVKHPFRSGVYIDDGAGCVEKVPQWMVDWDFDPGHREPR